MKVYLKWYKLDIKYPLDCIDIMWANEITDIEIANITFKYIKDFFDKVKYNKRLKNDIRIDKIQEIELWLKIDIKYFNKLLLKKYIDDWEEEISFLADWKTKEWELFKIIFNIYDVNIEKKEVNVRINIFVMVKWNKNPLSPIKDDFINHIKTTNNWWNSSCIPTIDFNIKIAKRSKLQDQNKIKKLKIKKTWIPKNTKVIWKVEIIEEIKIIETKHLSIDNYKQYIKEIISWWYDIEDDDVIYLKAMVDWDKSYINLDLDKLSENTIIWIYEYKEEIATIDKIIDEKELEDKFINAIIKRNWK